MGQPVAVGADSNEVILQCFPNSLGKLHEVMCLYDAFPKIPMPLGVIRITDLTNASGLLSNHLCETRVPFALCVFMKTDPSRDSVVGSAPAVGLRRGSLSQKMNLI